MGLTTDPRTLRLRAHAFAGVGLAAVVVCAGVNLSLTYQNRGPARWLGFAPTSASSSASWPGGVNSSAVKTRGQPIGKARSGPPSMFRLDPQHTNRSPFRAPAAPKVAWSYDTGGAIVTQPVMANGNVVVASFSGKVTALSATGRVVWQTDLGERIYGSPLVWRGRIFVGVDKGKFVALSADSGKERFHFDVADDADVDTPAVPMSKARMAFAAGGILYVLRRDGSVHFRYKHRRKIFSPPAITPQGLVVFGTQKDRFIGVAGDGSERFNITLGSDVDAGAAVSETGVAYAGSDAAEIVAVDTRSGKIKWQRKAPGPVRGPLSLGRDGTVFAAYYGSSPGIVALSGKNGSTLWRFVIHGNGNPKYGVHAAPIEAKDGTLIFGGQDDFVYGLSPEGKLRWKLKLGGDVDASLALAADGLLYAGCEDGKIYAIVGSPRYR